MDFMYFLIPCLILVTVFFYGDNNPLSNKSFDAFVNWMRLHKYSEQIIDVYKCNYRDPVLKLIINDYLRIRNGIAKIQMTQNSGTRLLRL